MGVKAYVPSTGSNYIGAGRYDGIDVINRGTGGLTGNLRENFIVGA
jgi:hypothetical protein